MTTPEILLTIVFGFAINECCDLSPWLARNTVRLAARLRYGDTARGRIRAEDLAAYVDTRPGKLLKLGAALCFFAVGGAAIARRRLRACAVRVLARDTTVKARPAVKPVERAYSRIAAGTGIWTLASAAVMLSNTWFYPQIHRLLSRTELDILLWALLMLGIAIAVAFVIATYALIRSQRRSASAQGHGLRT